MSLAELGAAFDELIAFGDRSTGTGLKSETALDASSLAFSLDYRLLEELAPAFSGRLADNSLAELDPLAPILEVLVASFFVSILRVAEN